MYDRDSVVCKRQHIKAHKKKKQVGCRDVAGPPQNSSHTRRAQPTQCVQLRLCCLCICFIDIYMCPFLSSHPSRSSSRSFTGSFSPAAVLLPPTTQSRVQSSVPLPSSPAARKICSATTKLSSSVQLHSHNFTFTRTPPPLSRQDIRILPRHGVVLLLQQHLFHFLWHLCLHHAFFLLGGRGCLLVLLLFPSPSYCLDEPTHVFLPNSI